MLTWRFDPPDRPAPPCHLPFDLAVRTKFAFDVLVRLIGHVLVRVMINIESLRHPHSRGVRQMLAARKAWIQDAVRRLRPDGGKNATETFFDDAPDTVLCLILKHLNALEILNAGATCRSLRRIIKGPELWRQVRVDASWSPAQVAAVVEACALHAHHVCVHGCQDPHTSRSFSVVAGRLARILSQKSRVDAPPAGGSTAPLAPLQLLEARAGVPTRHPPFRRPDSVTVVDMTAHIERLHALLPQLTVHLGGATPMYCAGSVDWYMTLAPGLRLDALSDIVVTRDDLREPNVPCTGMESARLVAASGARTVFVTANRWVEGEPLRAAAALLSAGARDFRLRLSPVSGVPALAPPLPDTPAGRLECLHVEFTGRARPASIETWLTWFLPHRGDLREVRFTDNTTGTEANALNAKTALLALKLSLTTPLDVLDLRNVDVLNPWSCDQNLMALLSSHNAPAEIRISEYIYFIEDNPGAQLFVEALGPRVRRLVITVLDACFGLHDRYFMRDVPRLQLPACGAVTMGLAAKKIDACFIFP